VSERLARTFAARRAAGRAALIPYFTAGDPDLATTRELVGRAIAAGADAIELGIPFSDPMADGPVLQRASSRALRRNTTLRSVLELAGELRRDHPDTPLVLFGYYNPFFRYGLGPVARDAARAGVDAFLCVDLPPEEAGDLRSATAQEGVDLISLLAPTTPPARIRRIARASSGFLYFVSVLGTTGARATLPPGLPDLVARVRSLTDLPIGVGFGVSQPEQAAWISGFADAVVVGSAIARVVEESEPADVVPRVEAFVRGLREAMVSRSPS
jgi:tryptophan synthase alpha chain